MRAVRRGAARARGRGRPGFRWAPDEAEEEAEEEDEAEEEAQLSVETFERREARWVPRGGREHRTPGAGDVLGGGVPVVR